jgi:hypothetical protein
LELKFHVMLVVLTVKEPPPPPAPTVKFPLMVRLPAVDPTITEP